MATRASDSELPKPFSCAASFDGSGLMIQTDKKLGPLLRRLDDRFNDPDREGVLFPDPPGNPVRAAGSGFIAMQDWEHTPAQVRRLRVAVEEEAADLGITAGSAVDYRSDGTTTPKEPDGLRSVWWIAGSYCEEMWEARRAFAHATYPDDAPKLSKAERHRLEEAAYPVWTTWVPAIADACIAWGDEAVWIEVGRQVLRLDPTSAAWREAIKFNRGNLFIFDPAGRWRLASGGGVLLVDTGDDEESLAKWEQRMREFLGGLNPEPRIAFRTHRSGDWGRLGVEPDWWQSAQHDPQPDSHTTIIVRSDPKAPLIEGWHQTETWGDGLQVICRQ